MTLVFFKLGLMCLVWENMKIYKFFVCEQCTFFSENVAVNLYPVSVVAPAFEYNVAITFVISISFLMLTK